MSKKVDKPKKSDWIVETRATVHKSIFCYNCTEEEAENTPYAFFDGEEELYQEDYSVTGVEENV